MPQKLRRLAGALDRDPGLGLVFSDGAVVDDAAARCGARCGARPV